MKTSTMSADRVYMRVWVRMTSVNGIRQQSKKVMCVQTRRGLKIVKYYNSLRRRNHLLALNYFQLLRHRTRVAMYLLY